MGIFLQQRDMIIIQELLSSAFLSFEQMVQLAFNGNKETARKRIGKLVQGKVLVIEKAVFARERVLRLADDVIGALIQSGFLSREPQAPITGEMLGHELLVRDVKIAL